MDFENTKVLNEETKNRLSQMLRDKLESLSDLDKLIGLHKDIIYDAHCLGLDELVDEMINDLEHEGYNINLNTLINVNR